MLDNPAEGVFIMKLTYEDKVEIYRLYTDGSMTSKQLGLKFGVNVSNIKYLISLIKLHGPEIVKHGKSKMYTKEFKEAALLRVLEGSESLNSVSLELGLPSSGLLANWKRSYIENGYNIIEKKRGRPKHESEREETSETIDGIEEEDQATREAKLAIINTGRIRKKIKRLNGGERQPTYQEITQVVTALRQEFGLPLSFILNTLNTNDDLPNLPRSVYYHWKDREDKDMIHDDLMNRIIEIYYHHKGRYGYRRITAELRKTMVVNNKLVKRLMKRMGLFGITPKAKYKSYKGDMNGTVKNLLLEKEVDTEKHKTTYKRNFSTTGPNQKWTTDVSEFHISAGKLYLSPILDMFNGEIVSYDISTSPNFKQTVDMLDMAFNKHSNLNGLIFQSDQGWQYQMKQYHQILQDKGILQSMSRKGNCLDNCVMENFFGKMKNEMFYGHQFEFKSLEHLKQEMIDYIEYYNTERIQMKLKGLTPCQAREQALRLQ